MTTTPTNSPGGAQAEARPPYERFIDGYQNQTYTSITEIIGDIVLSPRPPIQWFIVTGLAFVFVNVMFMAITWLVLTGVGIWGNNIPVGWSWDIINFVWWIGIGHAGTLIS